MADGTIAGGMIPKVESCVHAVSAGVRRAHILDGRIPVSYTHLRAHETVLDLVCRLLLEKQKHNKKKNNKYTQIHNNDISTSNNL